MSEFVIQKLEFTPKLAWIDVKVTDKTLEEAINSLDNFNKNNPNHMYRLVKVLYTTRSPLK